MITNEKLVFEVNENLNQKQILQLITEKLIEEKIATSLKPVLDGFLEREKQTTTGLADGIAIPHVSSSSIVEAKIVVLKLKNPIDWKSLDGKLTDLIIAIAVPETGRNDHFDLLVQISTMLSDQKFINEFKKSSPKKIVEILNSIKVEKKDSIKKTFSKDSLNVVGVTTCVTGVAHTFMAAKALEDEGRKRGWNIKIEKQGQMTKDTLTAQEIANADYVIIAKSKNISEPERFYGKKVYETEVAKPITKAKEVMDDMLLKAVEQTTDKPTQVSAIGEKKAGGASAVMAHLMTGISYMIPFIAMAGITLGLTTAFGFAYDPATNSFGPKNELANAFSTLAGQAFTLYIPILAMFIAYSISGRKAMAPAAILALCLNIGPSDATINGATVIGFAPFWNWGTMSFSGWTMTPQLGFLGAVASGYMVGYGVQGLTKYTDKIDVQVFQTILPLLLIPIIFTSIPFIFMAFFGYIPLFAIAYGLNKFVTLLIDNNLLFIAGAIMGAMICFDLGGPVNKVAMAIGAAFIGTDNVVVNGICAVSVSIPPAVLFFSLIFNKLTPLKMNEDDETAAATASVMGFFGITEGSIPFAAKDPKKWMPSFVIAGAVGGALMSFTKIGDNVAMWGGPIIYLAGGYGANVGGHVIQESNWTYTLIYFIPLAVAGLVGFLTASGLEYVYSKKNKKEVTNNDSISKNDNESKKSKKSKNLKKIILQNQTSNNIIKNNIIHNKI